ncbi:hypothetical protein HPP92_020417 [Vanilla planifolia]|uniref:Plastid lipid-associated protein/fibrillin conserved domain-containing protein n=1 Tax=Vanilla planifolia TaxID=51239 RepID=A0A835Q0N3_VANPL|nr:hypothetical protein HPP92_020417 [Vanilla planifolia]
MVSSRIQAQVEVEWRDQIDKYTGNCESIKRRTLASNFDHVFIIIPRYTAFSELIPLLALSSTPLLKIKKISQSIDSKNRTIVNETTLSSPGATFSFTASASFEVQTPSRIKVEFKEGAVRPPEVSPTLNLPETLEIFGQKVDLQPLKRSLDPLQHAFANISGSVSRQPPFKFPFPGNGARSWLLTTYLDEDFMISRGDGGLFVLAKEGCWGENL